MSGHSVTLDATPAPYLPSVPGYRHRSHAGNHADVLKHLVLVQVLACLKQEDTAWWYIDTHAGAGLYELELASLGSTGRHASGIGRLWGRSDLPPAAADYLGIVRAFNPDGRLRFYPGSPLIASCLLRPQDALHLFELEPTQASSLRLNLAARGRQGRIDNADGFVGLKGVLPPPTRRCITLIDPAYDSQTDYPQAIAALQAGVERCPSGIFALWYPLLLTPAARKLPQQLKRLPAKRWLNATLCLRSPSMAGHGMYGSGVFLVNPPPSLAATLASVLPWLVSVLGQNDGAGHQLEAQIP